MTNYVLGFGYVCKYKTRSGALFTTLFFHQNLRMVTKTKVLRYTRLERLAKDKHSSLLVSFVSFEENDAQRIWFRILLYNKSLADTTKSGF